MEGIVTWALVGILGGIAAFSLIPLFVRGSLQWPQIRWGLLLVWGGPGACILLAGLLGIGAHGRLVSARGRVAEGKVVDQRKEYVRITHNTNSKMDSDSSFGTSGSSSWVRYYPIVEFRSEQGELARLEGRVYGSSRPMLEMGSAVRVFYDPRHSSRAVLGTFYELWLRPLVVASAGLVFLVAGIWGFLASGRALRAADAEARSPEAMARQRERDGQARNQYPLRLRGTILRTERSPQSGPAQYRFVCQAQRPGAKTPEEFPSESFPWDPGPGWEGRAAELYLDPQDPQVHYLPLATLLEELLSRSG